MKDPYLERLKSERAQRAKKLATLKVANLGPRLTLEDRNARVRDLERGIAILDEMLDRAVAFNESRAAHEPWWRRSGFVRGQVHAPSGRG